MVNPVYNCSQQELYAAGRLGWNACSANLSDFSNFKTKYTAALIRASLEEIAVAELLPDDAQRAENSRTARVNLKNKGSQCLDYWQQLKRYISEAYPPDMVDIKLKAAGQAQYRRAAQNDWLALQRLMVDGSTFLIDNKQELITNGHMPEIYNADFTTAKADFDYLHQKFLSFSQQSELDTQAKVTANNQVFAKLISMFLDGQEIFKNNEALRKQFTMEQVLLTISGPGTQGVKGTVTNANGLPVTGAELMFDGDTSKTTGTDDKGQYECLQLMAGDNYTVTIKAAGYQEKIITGVEVATGVIKTLDAVLVTNII